MATKWAYPLQPYANQVDPLRLTTPLWQNARRVATTWDTQLSRQCPQYMTAKWNQLGIATCPHQLKNQLVDFLATMSNQLGIAKCPNQLKNPLANFLVTMSKLMHHLVERLSSHTNHNASYPKPTFDSRDLEDPAAHQRSGRDGNIFRDSNRDREI